MAEIVTPMIIGTMVMPSACGRRPSRSISQPAMAVAESGGKAWLTGRRPAYSQAASTMAKDAMVKAVERKSARGNRTLTSQHSTSGHSGAR
jgi:hypothetical protein